MPKHTSKSQEIMMTRLISFILLLTSFSYVAGATLGRSAAPSISKRVVCYFASWSIWRQGDDRFAPEDIHPHLCTHLVYAFAVLEKQEGIIPFDPKQDLQLDGYKKFIELKKRNGDLKLMLSVGGTKEGSPRFSQIAGDIELRQQFVKNSVRYLREFQFDGVDLAWQYPGLWTGSSASDRDNYVLMLKELREEIKRDADESGKPELILSIIVPRLEQEIIRGFDLENLVKYVDFMNIPTYDYHAATEPFVHHVSPLYTLPGDEINKDFTVDATVNTYLRLGVNPVMLNLGMPIYGISYHLVDPNSTDIGADADDEGEGDERGVLRYNQICRKVAEDQWTVSHVNKSIMGPYAFRNQQWVSYDDQESIAVKAKYAATRGIGGLMFWSVDQDDFRGVCHERTFPLIRAGLAAFITASDSVITDSAVPPISQATTSRPISRPSPSTSVISSRPSSQREAGGSEDDDSMIASLPSGTRVFKSQRDITFQNIKIWVNNYYGNQTPC